jgi:hypothetical protein
VGTGTRGAQIKIGSTVGWVSVIGSVPTLTRHSEVPTMSLLVSRSLVLAALLVAMVVSMVALAPSRERRRQAPLTPPARRGRSPAEGAATPNPLILGRLFRLVADRCDDLGFLQPRRLDACGRLVLFCVIK